MKLSIYTVDHPKLFFYQTISNDYLVYKELMGNSLFVLRFGRKPTIVCFHALCCVALIIATVLTTTAGK